MEQWSWSMSSRHTRHVSLLYMRVEGVVMRCGVDGAESSPLLALSGRGLLRELVRLPSMPEKSREGRLYAVMHSSCDKKINSTSGVRQIEHGKRYLEIVLEVLAMRVRTCLVNLRLRQLNLVVNDLFLKEIELKREHQMFTVLGMRL